MIEEPVGDARILCELGALPDEIRMAVEDNIKLHISPESQIILP